jgi:DNA-binding CsgD family transcriptional regulator
LAVLDFDHHAGGILGSDPPGGRQVSRQSDAISAAIKHAELAPFETSRWVAMLGAARDATGSRNCQFVALGDAGRFVPTNLYAEPYGDVLTELIELGGLDPTRNPYVDAGMKLRPSQIISDPEIISDDERKTHPLLGDLYVRMDLPHIAITKLTATDAAHWHLVALRSSKQGPILPDQRVAFKRIGKEVARATRMALAIRGEGAKLLSGALGSLSIAAFVFDGFARLLAASPLAESLLQEGIVLRGHSRTLRTPSHAGTMALQAMLHAAVHHRPGAVPVGPSRLALRDSTGAVVATAQAFALPRDQCDIGAAAAMLVVSSLDATFDPLTAAARQFRLTSAEQEVAKLLAAANPAREIAAARGTSVETARTQIKTIYAKLGVANHAAFVAAIAGLRQS